MSQAVTRFSSRRNGRRRGQALLLAVLLMIFAALLGSTFITVVALNLNQTARDEEKAAAKAATIAGLQAIDEQLVNSNKGEGWRPEQISPPPAPGDQDYDLYYTPLDQAQGWARTTPHPPTPYTDQEDWQVLEAAKRNGAHVFVKFPDPRQPIPNGVPIYNSEVTFLTGPDGTSLGNLGIGEDDKAGMLRITIIGLSPNNPNVFSRNVAYKPTSSKGSIFSFARYDANYNVSRNRPRATQTRAAVLTIATSLSVDDASDFAVGNCIMVSHASATNDSILVVKSVDYANNILTFNGALRTNYPAKSDVKVASHLFDALNKVDIDGWWPTGPGNAVGGSAAYAQRLAVSDSADETGIHINNGLSVTGKVLLGLRPADTNFKGDFLDVAGRIMDNPQTDVTGATTGAQSVLYSYTAPGLPATSVIPNPASTSTNKIPNSNQIKIASATTGTLPGLQGQVHDGITSSDPTQSEEKAKVIAPPNFNDAMARYRNLTQLIDVPGGSTQGYADGVYINNRKDFEQVRTATGIKPLSNIALQRLWQRKSFEVSAGGTGNIIYNAVSGPILTGANTDHYRLAYPRIGQDTYEYPSTIANQSLEQRGVRGWISPWEFLPRGVLVELQGDKIVVTRDDRSDQAWQAPTGGELNNELKDKTYRMVINLATGQRSFGAPGVEQDVGVPKAFNGVIFAEGNLRIRGYLDASLVGVQNLTIASMNNIYIEGRLWEKPNAAGDRGRIALMAKRNVVLNPSQFITRPAGVADFDRAAAVKAANISAASPTAASSLLTVSDSSVFQVADRIMINGDKTIYTVTKFDTTTANTLSVSPAIATTQSNKPVSLVGDPAVVSGKDSDANKTSEDYFRKLSNPDDIFLREAPSDGYGFLAGAAPHLAIQHAMERKKAFDLKNLVSSTATVKIKDDADNSKFIEAAEKKITSSGASIPGKEIDFNLVSPSAPTFTDFKNYLETAPFAPGLPDLPEWEITLGTAPNIGSLEARHLTQMPDRLTGKPYEALVSASTRFLYNTNPSAILLDPPSGSPQPYYFGSSLSPSPTSPEPEESPTFLQPWFYQRKNAAGTDYQQARMHWTSQKLTPITGSTADATFAFRPDFTDLAAHRIGALKLENDDFAGSAGNVRDYNPIPFTVEATIYAVEGSWFVIPMPLEKPFDMNGDVIPAPDTTYAVSRDVNITAQERDAATRYRRPNYQIAIRGSIAQGVNPTAILDYDNQQDPDNNNFGAVRTWLDSLSYPVHIKESAANGQPAPTYDGVGYDYQYIIYQSDPLPPELSLYLPVAPGMFYQG